MHVPGFAQDSSDDSVMFMYTVREVHVCLVESTCACMCVYSKKTEKNLMMHINYCCTVPCVNVHFEKWEKLRKLFVLSSVQSSWKSSKK